MAVRNSTVTSGKMMVTGDSDDTRGISCSKHITVCRKYKQWRRSKFILRGRIFFPHREEGNEAWGPKGREWGWSSWGGGSEPPPHQLSIHPFYLNQAMRPIHTHIHTNTKNNKNATQWNLEIEPIAYTTCKRRLHTKLRYYTHKSVMTQFFTSNGCGECCKLPQQGLGRNPQKIWNLVQLETSKFTTEMPYNMQVTRERLKHRGGEKTLSPRYFLLERRSPP